MSSRKGPIIIIEDDEDDREILREVFKDLRIANELVFFDDAEGVFYYLMDTTDNPMLILSDINLPRMSGLEMKRKINSVDHTRKKSIPFVFLSTSAKPSTIDEAYDLMAQGYFQKPNKIDELKKIIRLIIDFWSSCLHPNASS